MNSIFFHTIVDYIQNFCYLIPYNTMATIVGRVDKQAFKISLLKIKHSTGFQNIFTEDKAQYEFTTLKLFMTKYY